VSEKGTIKVWDMPTGRLLTRKDHWSAGVSFDSSGAHIASAGWADRVVRVWNLLSGVEVASFEGHRDRINAVAFAGGRQLVSAGDDRDVMVWELGLPDAAKRLRAPEIWDWRILGTSRATLGNGSGLFVQVELKNVGRFGRELNSAATILRGDGRTYYGVNQTQTRVPALDTVYAMYARINQAVSAVKDAQLTSLSPRGGVIARGVRFVVTPKPNGRYVDYDERITFSAGSEAAIIELRFSIPPDFQEAGLTLRFLGGEKPLPPGAGGP
jgi:hypothetical protein